MVATPHLLLLVHVRVVSVIIQLAPAATATAVGAAVRVCGDCGRRWQTQSLGERVVVDAAELVKRGSPVVSKGIYMSESRG